MTKDSGADAGFWRGVCATRLRSSFTDLNGCVGICMRAFLCYSVEPLITLIPADDLLQAVNSVTLARENIFCTHSTDCTCIGRLETENGGNMS